DAQRGASPQLDCGTISLAGAPDRNQTRSVAGARNPKRAGRVRRKPRWTIERAHPSHRDAQSATTQGGSEPYYPGFAESHAQWFASDAARRNIDTGSKSVERKCAHRRYGYRNRDRSGKSLAHLRALLYDQASGLRVGSG